MNILWKIKPLVIFILWLALPACQQDALLEEMAETPLNIEASIKEANGYFEQEDYAAAIAKYEEVLSNFEPQENCKIYPKLLLQLGKGNAKLQHYDAALHYYDKYLVLPQVSSDPKDKANGLGLIASAYQKIGNYETSYEYQIQALGIRESQKDSAGIGRSLYELGTLVFYQKNYELALKYYTGSMDLAVARKKDKAILSCLSALGPTYEGLGDSIAALKTLNRALDLARTLDIKSKEAYVLHNLGAHYLRKEAYDEAYEFLMESYQIKFALEDKWGLIGSHIYIGDLFREQGLLPQAEQEYDSGLRLATEIESKARKVTLYDKLGKVYADQKKYKEAIEMKDLYVDLKEKLLNEKLIEELGNKKIKYELEKKDREILLLTEQNRVKKMKTKTLWMFSFISVCLIGVSVRSRAKHRHNQALQEKNKEIKQKNSDLERKNDDLKKFAFIVSHDLKAPLRTIGSFTGLLKRRYFNKIDQDGQEYMDFITGGVKRMDQLLNDLLTYSQIENTDRGADWTETKDVIHNALSNLYFQIRNQNVAVKINEEALPRVKGNSAHLTQLFQNIIANGIKFRNGRAPQISIDCMQNEQKFTFAIKDNGIGIEDQYQEKIFRMFSRLHKVEEYEGTGIGLATCKKIVEKHGGKIWVKSAPGQGSTFYFSLPKN